MANFQGSGFALELPDEAQDVSSYCFSFPELGAMPPNLTVSVEKHKDQPDLEAFAEARTAPMRDVLDDFEVLSEQRQQRDNWDYMVSIVQWQAGDVLTRQKRLFIYVPEPEHTMYVLTATDLADNVENSDAAIDQVIRSFKPTTS